MAPAKIMTILGTRPETIKLAPVIQQLKQLPDRFVTRVCATAQHREMMDQALKLFNITPDIDLGIMIAGQTLADLTARAIRELDPVIDEEKPDVVLVQGDTTTAFCGALVAFYHRVPIGHVEAGLRTANKYAPFPEEANRCFISQIADYHFAPTARSQQALLDTGIHPTRVFLTGNTVIDALMWIRNLVRENQPEIPAALKELGGHDVILVTGHRRESFGEGFENICRAIREIADGFRNTLFVYPVHLNPHVREPVMRVLGNHPRVRLIEPLPYDAFIWLMNRAAFVLTDSGGVQEEAPVLGKPVLVMRETTERREGIDAGNAILVGIRKEEIAGRMADLLRSPSLRADMGNAVNPYGDGRAAARIVDILSDHLTQ